MPFTKETAVAAARASAQARREKSSPENNRTKVISLALSPEELDLLNNLAENSGRSRRYIVITAARLYAERLAGKEY